ncbi:hypothetical protein LPN04_30990 [Rugamonas sp. A1-17]|nr:hypothetical protein [Rugamonas sp. A1-17]
MATLSEMDLVKKILERIKQEFPDHTKDGIQGSCAAIAFKRIAAAGVKVGDQAVLDLVSAEF